MVWQMRENISGNVRNFAVNFKVCALCVSVNIIIVQVTQENDSLRLNLNFTSLNRIQSMLTVSGMFTWHVVLQHVGCEWTVAATAATSLTSDSGQ